MTIRLIESREQRRGEQPHFNNPAVVTQSWYVATRSVALRPGEVQTLDLLGRRIAVYRDRDGVAHALDARCAHLGADLGQGMVVGDGLRCPFHHWCFAADGSCREALGLDPAPQRHVRSYPTQERWGLIWLWNGSRPLFPLPDQPAGRWRMLRPPMQRIRCHPHLVIANGRDGAHFGPLHNMLVTAAPQFSVDDQYRLTLRLQGRPRARWLQRLSGAAHDDIRASFTTIGGNLAWATVETPLRLHMLFSARPTAEGFTETQTVLLVPGRWPWQLVRAAALMYSILNDDRRILERLVFRPGFTANDRPLAAFVDLVNRLEVW